MAVRKPHIYKQGYYFVTFTNANWLPLIEITDAYDLVYSWFDYLKKDGHKIISYVIMPNHIHMILGYKTGRMSLNTLVGNGKRFIGREIIKRLKIGGHSEILNLLERISENPNRKKRSTYAVFKASFDAAYCYTRRFLLQKINYIHANPCRKKWMLASTTIDYFHSSARYFETGIQGVYSVVNWMELEAMGWWKLQ